MTREGMLYGHFSIATVVMISLCLETKSWVRAIGAGISLSLEFPARA